MENKTNIPAFVNKTYSILNDPTCQNAIAWTTDGKQFVIKNVHELEAHVLPKYFRHSNLNSFIRQLNMYGFHKSRKDNSKIVFAHQLFKQSLPALLLNIRRKSKTDFTNDENIDPVETRTHTKALKEKSSSSIKMGQSGEDVQKNVKVKLDGLEMEQFKDTYQTIDSSTSIMLKPSWSLENTIEEFSLREKYPFRSFIERSEIFDLKGDLDLEMGEKEKKEDGNGEGIEVQEDIEDSTSIVGVFEVRQQEFGIQAEGVPSIRTINFLNEVYF